jgi:hypothetical protein
MSAHPLASWLQTRVAADVEPILPSRRRTRKTPRHRTEPAAREADAAPVDRTAVPVLRMEHVSS